ncbi:MAG TPA: PAS domain-containing protein [Anaeromyxobacter sp.]|nr:PAS domain-containing protein [Anaeromyxobacter sp.]
MRAVELLLPAGVLLGAFAIALVLRARRRRRPRGMPREIERLLEAVPGPFGDAVLVLDAAGRIVRANAAASVLAGAPLADLLGKPLSALGPDLPTVARGLSRGPATALVSIAARSGPRRARAALLRVGPDADVVVLRAEPPARPPPLPRRAPHAGAAPPPPERGPPSVPSAAASAAVREPLGRAGRAASLLRLSAPPLGARADAALAALEEALADAEHRLAALASAARPGARHALDLAALVEDVARAVRAPGVRARAEAGPARALADDRALRSALREALRALAAALPGEEVVVAACAAPEPAVELVAAGAPPADTVEIVRALLAPHGALAEEAGAAGRSWRLRLALPAPAVQPAETGAAPFV